MENRRLGPVVGLGTYRTFEGDVARARDVVDAALTAGVTSFDSSPMYGSAEEALGDALQGQRDGATVATKIWTPSAEEGRRQYERQRGFFGRVEIEQVHNLVACEEHLPWLEAERDAGRIDRIGVTHWSAGSFAELEQALAKRTLRHSAGAAQPGRARGRATPSPAGRGARDIAVIVMRPFGGTGAPLLRRAPPDDDLAPLAEFGIETWAQALLKWILSDPRVDLVIPATSRPARATENAAAGSPPWFGPDERTYVEQLART